jgi:hydroxyacylglutathione hydrolase
MGSGQLSCVSLKAAERQEVPRNLTITLGKRTNCYLLEGDAGFVLIDTGFPFQRRALREALDAAGCRPGNLPLVILTHGDIDHSGNVGYLRTKYGARIAMHQGDTAMCLTDGETRERNTQLPDDFPKVLFLWFIRDLLHYFGRKLLRQIEFEPFRPDVLLEDGQYLRPLGLSATAYHTPGHSKGSVSILTSEGDLYCGDHFLHAWGHVVCSPDDPSFPSTNERLSRLAVKRIYPGHGEAFSVERARLWGGRTKL